MRTSTDKCQDSFLQLRGNRDFLPSCLFCFRKSLSWHTALRIRRKSEKRDKEGRKMENGYRKTQDGLANKVSVKVESVKITFKNVSSHFNLGNRSNFVLKFLLQLLNPNFIHDGMYTLLFWNKGWMRLCAFMSVRERKRGRNEPTKLSHLQIFQIYIHRHEKNY